MSKLTTEESKTIEGYWLNIKQLRNELKYRKWELTENQTTDENIGGGKTNRISDTTAQKAIILAEDKKYQTLKERVNAIDCVYRSSDAEMQDFVETRYFSENSAYIDWEDVAMELGVTKSKAFKMRNKLIDETARKLGWL